MLFLSPSPTLFPCFSLLLGIAFPTVGSRIEKQEKGVSDETQDDNNWGSNPYRFREEWALPLGTPSQDGSSFQTLNYQGGPTRVGLPQKPGAVTVPSLSPTLTSSWMGSDPFLPRVGPDPQEKTFPHLIPNYLKSPKENA